MLISLLNLPFRLGCQHEANLVGELIRFRVDTKSISPLMFAWHLEKDAEQQNSPGNRIHPLRLSSPVAWGFSLECS